MTQKKIPIWLDCDPGHDDAFAILLSLFHPSCHLLGLSTVSGNASLAHTTHNALAILAALGHFHSSSSNSNPTIPVIQGASKPLSRPINYAPEIHGDTGLDGVSLLPTIPAYETDALPEGVQHISQAILAQPKDEVWIVATGPLTNIAVLFREFPEVLHHVRGVSIMGGAIGEVAVPAFSPSSSPASSAAAGLATRTAPFSSAPPHRADGKGNWTPHAEFNIFADPEAAAYVLNTLQEHKKPAILIPLDLTHQVRGTAAVQSLLFPSSSSSSTQGKSEYRSESISKIRQMFKQILLYFSDTYAVHSGITDGPPLHDPLAVFAVVEPGAFEDGGGERWQVNVDVSDGERAGETVATLLRQDNTGGGVRIPRSVNLDRFWRSVDDALAVAEKKVAGG